MHSRQKKDHFAVEYLGRFTKLFLSSIQITCKNLLVKFIWNSFAKGPPFFLSVVITLSRKEVIHIYLSALSSTKRLST